MLAGLAAGYPALRRKGLFLGLTTLGLALIIDRFVFNTAALPGRPPAVARPSSARRSSASTSRGDRAFYFYELVVVVLVLALARNLRSGRLGRVLAAMRDSETAAQSVGIGLRRAKLFVFGVSSAMAGIGGALLTQANQNWDTVTFNPVFGLFWFTAVVVCGVVEHRRRASSPPCSTSSSRGCSASTSQSAIGVFGLAARCSSASCPAASSPSSSRIGRRRPRARSARRTQDARRPRRPSRRPLPVPTAVRRAGPRRAGVAVRDA